jgi:hypothetical protein
MKIKVEEKQNIYDIALKYAGSQEAVFEIAKLNDISVSDVLGVGTSLKVYDVAADKNVINYYKNNNVNPATGLNIEENEILECEEKTIYVTNNFQVAIMLNNGF